ncbi:MAG TPA: metallophosphoesterase [Chroococcales cyanobacterium]
MDKATISKAILNKKVGIAAGSLALAGLGAFIYGTKIESRRYRLETVKITTRGGSRAVSGDDGSCRLRSFKILHLSDLHLCEPESHKIKFVQKVTDADYDLIVFTGDIFENYSGMKYASSLITRPAKLVNYAVLGNHDYYDYNLFNKLVGRLNRSWRHPDQFRDVDPLIQALESAGIEVMRNETRRHPEQGLHVVGVDYPGIRDEELKSLADEAPSGHCVLALFHIPRRIDKFVKAGVHLALGGHTHGGQIRIPGVGAIITDCELDRSEASGVIWRDDTAFHISRGLGADPRTNIRFFCPPAATIIELTHDPLARSTKVQRSEATIKELG